ncbi:MAG: hypothetical protein IH953_02805 [Chloroflexi bacterium]|nr:hypothetical protein [Chloroflexota bacterium]
MSKKEQDAVSILGPELAALLEEAAARQDEIKRRSMAGLDFSALIVRDRHGSTGAPAAEPKANPVSLLLENDDYQQSLSLIEPLLENALSEIINSQFSPITVIEQASQIAALARPLKANALSVLAEAANLAKGHLAASSPAVDTQALERASVQLIEVLVTHFPPVGGIQAASIGAREDSGEAMREAQKRMLALIEPGISAVPEVTADHLAELVQSVVSAIVDGNQTTEVAKMKIPSAEYSHTQSSHNVTPTLRSIIRRGVGLEPSAPAPRLVQRSPAPDGRQAVVIMPEQLAQAVKAALMPIVRDLNALKLRSNLASRSIQRRALAPIVSRASVAQAVGGGSSPMVIRTVKSHAYGGLPTHRRVFSPAEVSRNSVGLGLTERSGAPTRPAAFPSRYTSSTFATQAARDHFDAGFENKPNGVITPGKIRLEVPAF